MNVKIIPESFLGKQLVKALRLLTNLFCLEG